jgi:hypothetical protein
VGTFRTNERGEASLSNWTPDRTGETSILVLGVYFFLKVNAARAQ